MHHYLRVGRLELQMEHVECAGVDIEAAVILHDIDCAAVRDVVVAGSLLWPADHQVLYVGPHHWPSVAPALVNPADILSQHLTVTHRQHEQLEAPSSTTSSASCSDTYLGDQLDSLLHGADGRLHHWTLHIELIDTCSASSTIE